MSPKRGSKKKGVLPKLKKNISSFTKSERGQISKQSMLTVGSIVGGAAIGTAISLKAVKGFPGVLQTSTAVGTQATSTNFSHTEVINDNVEVRHERDGGMIILDHNSY